jgi:hypothetical protein
VIVLALARWLVVTLVLIQLTAADGSEFDVNPATIVSLRPAENRELFHKAVNCIVATSDGGSFGVAESCFEVRRKIGVYLDQSGRLSG